MSNDQPPSSILKKVDTLEKLEAFLKKKKKSSKDHLNYDILFRSYITTKSPAELDNILSLFLPKLDVNFQNFQYNKTTPLMYLIDQGLFNLGEILIDETGKDLDLTIKDDLNENIFFKIIRSKYESGKFSLFQKALNLLKDETEEDEYKETLESVNHENKTLIECALNIGNSDIVSMLLNEGVNLRSKNSTTNDNIIHFAIKGKNPNTLKLVIEKLKELSNEEIKEILKEKNADGLTDLDCARKMNLYAMVKLINDLGCKANEGIDKIESKDENEANKEDNEKEVFELLTKINENNEEKIIKDIKTNFYLSEWNKILMNFITEKKPNKNYNKDILKNIDNFFKTWLIAEKENIDKNERDSNKNAEKVDDAQNSDPNSKNEINENEEHKEAESPLVANMRNYGVVRNKSRFNFSDNDADDKNIEINVNDILKKIKFDKTKVNFYINFLTNSLMNGNIENNIQIFRAFIIFITDEKNTLDKNIEFIFFTNCLSIIIEQCLSDNLLDYALVLINSLNSYMNNFSKTIGTNNNAGDKSNDNKITKNKKDDDNSAYFNYLSHNEIINPNLEEYFIIPLLYKCFYHCKKGFYQKAQENISEIKDILTKKKILELPTTTEEQKCSYPFLDSIRRFYYYLKIHIDFQLKNSSNFYKHLDTMFKFNKAKSNNGEANDKDQSKQNDTSIRVLNDNLYYYNSLCLQNLRLKKYSLALLYIKKCISIINSNQMLYTNYSSYILYNYSLCLFFSKNFKEAIKIFKILSNSAYVENNPYYYYRYGISCLQVEMENEFLKSKNENVNELLKEALYNKDIEDPNLQKRYILVNEKLGKDAKLEYLEEGIKMFKNCIMILEGKGKAETKVKDVFIEIQNLENSGGRLDEYLNIKELNLNTNSEDKELNSKENSNNKDTSQDNKNSNSNNSEENDIENKDNSSDNKDKDDENILSSKEISLSNNEQSNGTIYLNSHLYLLFSMIKTKQYTEALSFIQKMKNNNKFNLNDPKLSYQINNYLVEIYLKLNQYEKALEILSSINLSLNDNQENSNENSKELLKGDFYCENNKFKFANVSYKLALYVNLVKLYLLNKKEKDAENMISSILNMMNQPNEKVLQPYVCNVIMFYFLYIGKYEEAVHILKYRTMPKIYHN